MFTRSVLKTLVLNTICTVCITQTVYYTGLLCVKYGMHAYAGPTCICRAVLAVCICTNGMHMHMHMHVHMQDARPGGVHTAIEKRLLCGA